MKPLCSNSAFWSSGYRLEHGRKPRKVVTCLFVRMWAGGKASWQLLLPPRLPVSTGWNMPNPGMEMWLGWEGWIKEKGRKVKSPSTEDVTEKGLVILEKEISKRGDQDKPFDDDCWKKSSGSNMAEVAQLLWLTTQTSECGVRSTATLAPDGARDDMVLSTRLLSQTFLDSDHSH